MPAVSFSSRGFVDKINEMDVFTTFRVHTRDPPRLKVEDIVTCFFKQRAKRICRNCLNFTQIDALGSGWCMDDERAFAENICDDFNKIICKAEVTCVELATIGKYTGIFYVTFREGDKRKTIPERSNEMAEIARLDKFDSVGEFFEFFNSHYSLPMLFDRYTFRRIV